MFGAETILMNRCKNREVFEKTVHLINDFKDYFTRHNQTIYETHLPAIKKAGFPHWRTSLWGVPRSQVLHR